MDQPISTCVELTSTHTIQLAWLLNYLLPSEACEKTPKPNTPGLCLSKLRNPFTCSSKLHGFCWQRWTETGVEHQTPAGLFKSELTEITKGKTKTNQPKKKNKKEEKKIHESLDDKIWKGTYTTEKITDREHL